MPPSAWNHADNRMVSAHRCWGVRRIQLAVSSPWSSSSETLGAALVGRLMGGNVRAGGRPGRAHSSAGRIETVGLHGHGEKGAL